MPESKEFVNAAKAAAAATLGSSRSVRTRRRGRDSPIDISADSLTIGGAHALSRGDAHRRLRLLADLRLIGVADRMLRCGSAALTIGASVGMRICEAAAVIAGAGPAPIVR